MDLKVSTEVTHFHSIFLRMYGTHSRKKRSNRDGSFLLLDCSNYTFQNMHSRHFILRCVWRPQKISINMLNAVERTFYLCTHLKESFSYTWPHIWDCHGLLN